MGYRTHLTLFVPGNEQLLVLRGKTTVGNTEVEQILTKKFPTRVFLLNEKSISKRYFNNLPEDLEIEKIYQEDEHPIWFDEYSDNGEIHVGAMIALLEKIQEIQKEKKELNEELDFRKEPWYTLETEELLKDLKFWLSSGIIKEDFVIKFEVW